MTRHSCGWSAQHQQLCLHFGAVAQLVSGDSEITPISHGQASHLDQPFEIAQAEQEYVLDHIVGRRDFPVAIIPSEFGEFQEVESDGRSSFRTVPRPEASGPCACPHDSLPFRHSAISATCGRHETARLASAECHS